MFFSVDEDEKDGAMDESGTTATGGGGGRGSSRTGGNTGMSGIPRANRDAMHIAQTLFPSTLCTAFVEVIGLLDDHAVSLDGTGVYEVAYQVICNLILFLIQKKPCRKFKMIKSMQFSYHMNDSMKGKLLRI